MFYNRLKYIYKRSIFPLGRKSVSPFEILACYHRMWHKSIFRVQLFQLYAIDSLCFFSSQSILMSYFSLNDINPFKAGEVTILGSSKKKVSFQDFSFL